MFKKIFSLALFLILFSFSFLILKPALAVEYDFIPFSDCVDPQTRDNCQPFICCQEVSDLTRIIPIKDGSSCPSIANVTTLGTDCDYSLYSCCVIPSGYSGLRSSNYFKVKQQIIAESSTATQTGTEGTNNTFVPATVSIDNPLCADGKDCITVPGLIGRVIDTGLGLVGSIALLMFIFGGFKWLTSGGNTKDVEDGKNILMWSTVGLVVIFSSYAIVKFVISAVTTGR
jgi:hypothetical protein